MAALAAGNCAVALFVGDFLWAFFVEVFLRFSSGGFSAGRPGRRPRSYVNPRVTSYCCQITSIHSFNSSLLGKASSIRQATKRDRTRWLDVAVVVVVEAAGGATTMPYDEDDAEPFGDRSICTQSLSSLTVDIDDDGVDGCEKADNDVDEDKAKGLKPFINNPFNPTVRVSDGVNDNG